MPIHDVGYRSWKGALTSSWTRWWVIAEAGLRGAFKSRWVRRMLLAAWIPTIGLAVIFFLFERYLMEFNAAELRQLVMKNQQPRGEMRLVNSAQYTARLPQFVVTDDVDPTTQLMREKAVSEIAQHFLGGEALVAAIESGHSDELRNKVWCWLLMSFLRYPQGIMTLMIVGLLVPPLISRDVRSRAFLLYYARPINRIEYIAGKLAVPGIALMLITLIPALGLYCFGLMLSPDLSVVKDTWDIPVRIALATAAGVIPTSLIALLFSSLTQESRFAGFAWFTVWGLGAVVWTVIYVNMAQRAIMTHSGHLDSLWSLVSIYSTIGRVQLWVFGLEPNMQGALPSILMLVAITVLASLWLLRRVAAPVRI